MIMFSDRTKARTTHPDRAERQAIQTIRRAFVLGLVFIVSLDTDVFCNQNRDSHLVVEPSVIVLDGTNRNQQLLVSLRTSGEPDIDVTRVARFESFDERVVRLQGSLLRGVANGQAQLRIRYEEMSHDVTVSVQDFDSYPPVHFSHDVIPVFSKLGCNSGGCHGRASGQNGFKLSVFGFDPAADYSALVKEGRGRRLFPASPDQSLLLSKAMAQVPHGGGKRVSADSRDHEVLYQWIRQGMPFGEDHAPAPVAIQVTPGERMLRIQTEQQLLSTVKYSDGTQRDVTAAATYTSNAPHVADVEQGGLVRVGEQPGEAAITVNYMGHVTVTRLMVPRLSGGAIFPDLPSWTEADFLVWSKLRKMGIIPSEVCDDATFIRRLYLDVLGTLPRPDEVRMFLQDKQAGKRDQLIDDVLDREERSDYWALKWADILLVDRDKLSDRGAYEFHRWLRDQILDNRPYDQWVRELITASGHSGKYGPVNLFRSLRTPEELAKSVSQAFLGVRIECAQCHHHPFERWAQEDFYGFSGFFNGVQRKPTRPDPGVAITDQRPPEVVYHAGYRPTQMPLTGTLVATRPLGGVSPESMDRGDPRVHLAEWMTAPQNPWFSRLIANRLWKHFLGRGLVEPEDDLRTTNPATNEPLLQYLAEQVVATGYDLKAMMKLIVSSRVYQLSSEPNETNYGDVQNYSHYYVKRLPAEVLLDAICDVTDVPEQFPGLPAQTRAIELWNNRLPSYFLEIFGRPERKSPCECGRSSQPTMAQALHLMNAPEIERKIHHPEGRVSRMVRNQSDPNQILEEICLAALGRFPTEREKHAARLLLGSGDTDQESVEDLLWTFLNSYDFLFIR